ncbi:sigma-70 family RNA polymerase sigma factor [Termitidicoccus mucosus]
MSGLPPLGFVVLYYSDLLEALRCAEETGAALPPDFPLASCVPKDGASLDWMMMRKDFREAAERLRDSWDRIYRDPWMFRFFKPGGTPLEWREGIPTVRAGLDLPGEAAGLLREYCAGVERMSRLLGDFGGMFPLHFAHLDYLADRVAGRLEDYIGLEDYIIRLEACPAAPDAYFSRQRRVLLASLGVLHLEFWMFPGDVKLWLSRLSRVVRDARRCGDLLFEHCLGRVGYYARRYSGRVSGERASSYDDLFQEGCRGLQKALAQYDPSRVGFYTYIELAVERVIRDYLAAVTLPMRMPVSWMKGRRRLEWVEHEFFAKHGRRPDLEEMAAAMDWSEQRVSSVLSLREMSFESLDREVYGDSGDSSESLGQFLTQEPAWEPSRTLDAEELRDLVRQALERLPDSERALLSHRFGFESDDFSLKSYAELSKVFGLPEETIRYACAKAVRRMKACLVSSPFGRELALFFSPASAGG